MMRRYFTAYLGFSSAFLVLPACAESTQVPSTAELAPVLFPLVLLTAFFGTFSKVHAAVRELDVTRNWIFGITDEGQKLTLSQRSMLLRNDWLPTWVTIIAALFLMSLVFGILPEMMLARPVGLLNLERIASMSAGLISFALGCTIVVTGRTEYRAMSRHIGTLKIALGNEGSDFESEGALPQKPKSVLLIRGVRLS